MIPLRDTTRSKTIPFVNYVIVGTCGLVYLYEVSLNEALDPFLRRFGTSPETVSSTLFAGKIVGRALFPLLTSMFLHGGLLHLLGNMLFLYVFGDNVEDRLGHLGYLVFYVLCGVGASLVQVYANPGSTAPLIGASGAIAGVLGAYFLLFPRSRVLTLIPLFVFFPVVEISAFFFLGFWFILQFAQAWLSAGPDASGVGVAWWAHAGGFVAGAALMPVFLLIRKIV